MTDSGIICVYKEAGWTSFDVVAKLRNKLKVKKVGHTGTLDPDATGVLVICFGRATKLCEKIAHTKKVYQTTMLLGKKTDTQDISGTVLSQSDYPKEESEVKNVIESFVGESKQLPPMYSAKKVKGKKLYEYARAGKEVERKPSDIIIDKIIINEINLPRVNFSVYCSPGTYIRTLCNDIGDKLGCGACMESLIRLQVGEFEIKNALKISEIVDLIDKDDFSFVIPIDKYLD